MKGENLDGKSSKYISFLPPGRERFVRGSVKSLGAEYTKERIAERISERVQNRGKRLIDTLSGTHCYKFFIEYLFKNGIL